MKLTITFEIEISDIPEKDRLEIVSDTGMHEEDMPRISEMSEAEVRSEVIDAFYALFDGSTYDEQSEMWAGSDFYGYITRIVATPSPPADVVVLGGSVDDKNHLRFIAGYTAGLKDGKLECTELGGKHGLATYRDGSERRYANSGVVRELDSAADGAVLRSKGLVRELRSGAVPVSTDTLDATASTSESLVPPPSGVAAGCPACGGTGRMGPYFSGGLSTICGNCHNPAPQPNKYAVKMGSEWFVASSLRQSDGAFDTYNQAMREATYLNCRLAIQRGLLDEKMPGGYPFTYRQHYERVFGLPASPQLNVRSAKDDGVTFGIAMSVAFLLRDRDQPVPAMEWWHAAGLTIEQCEGVGMEAYDLDPIRAELAASEGSNHG